ncbi:MAG: DUF933 domain-containing protein [Candidatus Omnitrophica bacterium]|nr:DUF933 domain-containing protein [Candidatus Omnitrophota bacterium]
MKIFTEIEQLWGKKIFKDHRLEKLKERFNCPAVNYYTVEFLGTDIQKCDCLVVREQKVLDFIVEDLERAEMLSLKKPEDVLVKKILEILNSNKLLFDKLEEEELEKIKEYAFITAKPIVLYKDTTLEELLMEVFKKTNSIFFFTIVKNQATAWLVKSNTTIVNCAAKIHTDLAKGFIRAEVFNVSNVNRFRQLEDAKIRGFLIAVDKDYIVKDGDVLDIKFNVAK